MSEGAGENIFVVKNGVIYTPDLSAGALNGITRNTVLHISKDLGLEIVQKRITRDEVYIADEAFFTGTAAEVTPIRELDRIELGKGDRQPRPDHRKNPERLLRHRQRPQSQIRPLAHQGLNPHVTSNRRTPGQGPERPRRRALPQPQGRHEAVEQPPKVYLDVAHTGEGKCPYCGTVYRLKAGEVVRAGIELGACPACCRGAMRVMHFVTGGFSGATQVAVDLCLAARSAGMDVVLVLRRKRRTTLPAKVEALRAQGLDVRVVPGWADAATVWALRALALEWRPDILVAHGYSEHLWGRYAGLLAQVPRLVHVEHNSASGTHGGA